MAVNLVVQHAYRDGRLEEINLRHLGAEDGITVIAKDIRFLLIILFDLLIRVMSSIYRIIICFSWLKLFVFLLSPGFQISSGDCICSSQNWNGNINKPYCGVSHLSSIGKFLPIFDVDNSDPWCLFRCWV